MIRKIYELEINKDFTTTVEITGVDNGNVLFFSHGFGVQRDSRGMFVDIENAVKDRFLCVRFEFNEVLDNGDTIVHPYSVMANTLSEVILAIESEYDFSNKHLIAHSLGGIIAALVNPQDFTSVILLAPPPLSPYNSFINYFRKRENTAINISGRSIIRRSDGTKTIVGKEFFDEMKNIKPVVLYTRMALSTELHVVRPIHDEVVKDAYEKIYKIPGIEVVEQTGDHDFSGRGSK